MERRQAFQFELRPNAEQRRQMSRFAGCPRYVYNKAPKIGWVRYRNSREVLGAVRSVTVSQSAGKWLVSITTLREVAQPQHPSTSAVGLDWGVASFVVMSNGEVLGQLQPLKQFLPRLTKLQGRMARKKKFLQQLEESQAARRQVAPQNC